MKPLLGVVSYNRKKETLQTLESLYATNAMVDADVVVFDNGSTDGTWEALQAYHWELQEMHGNVEMFGLYLNGQNIGCPRALNWILIHGYRHQGQDFIKVDNDVKLLTYGWVAMMRCFLDDHPGVGLSSPWYEELETSNQGRVTQDYGSWQEIFPVVGHTCYHRAEVLDRSGFFDVLALDHLYGFEDLLMAHRAAALGYKCAVLKKVRLENLQRHNSLDVGRSQGTNEESCSEHVKRLRPLYDQRRERIHQLAGSYFVAANGEILE